MKKFVVLCGVLVFFLSIVSCVWAQEVLKVQLKTGTGIADKEISGEAVKFPSNVGKVFCWSVVEGAVQPTSITHVWYHNGSKVREIELAVKNPRHRTWSEKNILPSMAGEWKVEVLDVNKKVLNSISFNVEK